MKSIHSLLLGTFSGMVLHLIGSIASLLPYCNLSDSLFSVMLVVSILLGAVFSFTAIILKNRSFRHAALRFLAILVSYFGLVILNGFYGTIPFLLSILNIPDTSAASNVSGIIMLFFIATLFTASFLAILTLVGIRITIRIFRKKK